MAPGLHFAVSPDKFPVDDYVLASQAAAKLLPDDTAEQLNIKWLVCNEMLILLSQTSPQSKDRLFTT